MYRIFPVFGLRLILKKDNLTRKLEIVNSLYYKKIKSLKNALLNSDRSAGHRVDQNSVLTKRFIQQLLRVFTIAASTPFLSVTVFNQANCPV